METTKSGLRQTRSGSEPGSPRRTLPLQEDYKRPLPLLVPLAHRTFVSPIVVWPAILCVFAVVDILVIIAAVVALFGGGDVFA